LADIHIFWEQACGQGLGNTIKSLIYKDFSCSTQSVAANRHRMPSQMGPGFWRDIPAFWWQACGQGLDKRLNTLIQKDFLVSTTIKSVLTAWRAPDGYPHLLVASLWTSA
jgi:hypothetical protein